MADITEVRKDANAPICILLDESSVSVCESHDPCAWDSEAAWGPDCEPVWIYGVGGAAFETSEDQMTLRTRLQGVHERLSIASYVADNRGERFRRKGWHATDDQPQYAEGLLTELRLGSSYKGHVRYTIRESALASDQTAAVYRDLFIHLLRAVLARYSDAAHVAVIFESDGTPLSDLESWVASALPRPDRPTCSVSSESKGDPLLAIADYLLYYSLKAVAHNIKTCPGASCEESHSPPTAGELVYDANGELNGVGHLTKRDYIYRNYAVFARSMSSIVRC